MSLQELFFEANKPEFQERRKWFAEIARRALAECNDPATPVRLCQYLLEGGLSPWILGYDFHPRDGLDALLWLVAGNLGEPEACFKDIKKLYTDREPRCQEVWDSEHVAYRCLTCGLSTNSCICVYCFDPEIHAGHDFRLYRSSTGGCCDCGDVLAWKPSGFCKRHAIPDAPRPSLLPPVVQTGAKIAIRAVVLHLIWALRRTFYAGKHRPEVSGTYGVARCIRWLNHVQGICPDMCKLVGEIMNEKRDVCAESTGWGNYCPAFAIELVLDETAVKALVRLGCYLPPLHCSELTSLFLKLLLDSQFKVQFTNAIIANNDSLLCLLGACNPELQEWANQQLGPSGRDNDEMDVLQDVDSTQAELAYEERILRKYAQEYPFDDSSSSPPPHYSAPKHPRVFSNEVISCNARRFLDRIYCQVIHAESVALAGSVVLLDSLLRRLNDHFHACLYPEPEPGAGLLLDLSKTNHSFPRRIFSLLDLIFQHDSVCLVAMNSEERFALFLSILRSCQLLNCLRRRGSDEDHVLMPDPYHQAFNLYFEIEERMIGPVLRTFKNILKEESNEALILRIMAQTKACLEDWTSQALNSVLGNPAWGSFLSPLTRLYFGLLELIRKDKPQYLVRLNLSLESILPLCIPSLRALNMLLEIQDGLWVRNGQTMLNSVLYYVKLYSPGTLESDLLVLRFPFLLFGQSDPTSLEVIFEMWKEALGDANFLRVMGCVAYQGAEFTSTKTAALHWLASRDCTFSEIEQISPPVGSHEELERILNEIAIFQEASTHPGGLPAHYKLKAAEWDNVIFGGFYLRYLCMDEESALTRYKRARGMDMNRVFIPPPHFPLSDPVCRAVLSSTTLYGTCLKSLSTNASEEQMITAALLCLGALEFFSKTPNERMELFPRQSLSDLLEYNEAVKLALPANIFDTLKSTLAPSKPTQDMEVESSASQSTDEKIRSKAARAQQKALKAFAKKQKNFQFVEELLEEEQPSAQTKKATSPAAPSPGAGSQEDVEVCALCRKTSGESEEMLAMLGCMVRTSLMNVRESVTLEGEGQCVAHAPEPGHVTRYNMVPQGITSEVPVYMSQKSISSYIETIRHQLDYKSIMDDPADRRPITPFVAARTLIHTCGHSVHPSCLKRYRDVVINRAVHNMPYEGMNVINVANGELFCPVCRRVTNMLIPLPDKVERMGMDATARSTEGNQDTHGFVQMENGGEVPSTLPLIALASDNWLASRLEPAMVDEGHVFPNANLTLDPALSEVVEFFERCPAIPTNTYPHFTIEHNTPSELILTLLHTCDDTHTAPITAKKVIPLLMNLALRQPYVGYGGEAAQAIISQTWRMFVRNTFCDSARLERHSKRHLTALSQDLSLVLLNWIVLNGDLRFELVTSPKVKEEARKALRFLLIFARIQDAIIRAIFSNGPNGEPSPSSNMPIESEIIRSAAVEQHCREIDANSEIDADVAFHRLSAKEREQLARICSTLRDEVATKRGQDLAEAFRTALFEFIPFDCPPYAPACSVDELVSKEDQLRRHAVLLFGEDILDFDETLPAAEAETALNYVEQTLTQFLRELKELVGHTDRPMNTSVVTYRMRFSALLPRLYRTSCPLLVRLPQQYSSITIGYVARRAYCAKCKKHPETPALCLLCGQLLCYNSDCCAERDSSYRIDELTIHGSRCPRGSENCSGVFLLINSGKVIILLGLARQCVWGALYLDAHDEEDRDLRRGKPLFLNKERLSALEEAVRTQDWLVQSKVLDKIKFQ